MQMLSKLLCSRTDRLVEESTYRPQRFQLSVSGDGEKLLQLLHDRPETRVYDAVRVQIRDLIRTRNPGHKFTVEELDHLVTEHSCSRCEEYGVWFYYPWSARLIHVLDEAEFVELRTNRNRYKITPEEQAKLSRKRIGVVGLSVGQSVALTLAMERSFGEIRLADFDQLDLSNLNRVRTGLNNLGLPKVYITAREIAEIDPYLEVKCFPAAIDEMNCDSFLLDPSPLDVLVEECDSIDIKVLLRYRARLHRIPVVMDTCDRGMLDIERFDKEPERPIFHGLVGDLEPQSLRGLTNEQKIPHVLQIIGANTLSDRLRASLIEVEQSISTWPQLASAVAHGGAATANVVRRICIGDSVCSGRYYFDLDAMVPSEGSHACTIGALDTVRADSSPGLRPEDMISAVSRLCRQAAPTKLKLMPELVRRLVADACQAPSGGNCQPWKWLSDGEYLYLFHDVSRSSAPLDPHGLGGLVALGAATENLALSAHSAGLRVVTSTFPAGEMSTLVVQLKFNSEPDAIAEALWRPELYSMIGIRRTNRKLGSRCPFRASDEESLTAAVRSVPGADIRWLVREDDLDRCGELMGMGDRFMFLTKNLHRFLINEIRWTTEDVDTTRDGIPLDTLELSPKDRAGLQLCRHWPALKLVQSFQGGHGLETLSRRAVAGAAAFALVTMESQQPLAYFNGGRAVERLWLTAAEHGIALHPMTGLSYLLSNLSQDSLHEGNQAMFSELKSRYQGLFPQKGQQAHLFLFRLSYAKEVSQRSLRRHLDDVLVFV